MTQADQQVNPRSFKKSRNMSELEYFKTMGDMEEHQNDEADANLKKKYFEDIRFEI